MNVRGRVTGEHPGKLHVFVELVLVMLRNAGLYLGRLAPIVPHDVEKHIQRHNTALAVPLEVCGGSEFPLNGGAVLRALGTATAMFSGF